LEINRKQIPAHISTMGRTSPEGESDMNAAITWLLPRVSAKSVDEIESFISIALFCGVGLLLSLSVLIADQYIPGEWFWSPDRDATFELTHRQLPHMEREKPVRATILAALAIAMAVWATIGPPPHRPAVPVKLAVGR
jgi:hypothetical protein